MKGGSEKGACVQGVCVCDRHPLDPESDTPNPGAENPSGPRGKLPPPWTATEVGGGTHPTGIYSCYRPQTKFGGR